VISLVAVGLAVLLYRVLTRGERGAGKSAVGDFAAFEI
jgi:hypothetical protein